jgi:hypothetical protein
LGFDIDNGAAPHPEVDARAAELRTLIQRIPTISAHGTPLFNRLLALANTANNIPSQNEAAKAEAIRQLREALDGAGSGQTMQGATPPDSATRSPRAGVRLTEALMIWNRTRSYVGQQVTRLQQEIIAQTRDEEEADEISANVVILEDLLDLLDDSLSEKLSELRAAAEPAAKAALSEQAKEIVISFQNKVAEDKLMNRIDHNGFVELDIKPTVTATLIEVLKCI